MTSDPLYACAYIYNLYSWTLSRKRLYSGGMSTHTTDAQNDDVLRAAGLRVTAPRLAVLDIVDQYQHSDADTIASHVRERLGTVSKQAVYDVLHALSDAGLVRRITVDGRRALYETHRHDNHHHVVCRGCGRIEDVQCKTGSAPCLHVSPHEDFGFAIDEAEVVFRGLCPTCQSENAPVSQPAGRADHASVGLTTKPTVKT